ncbi:MAG: aminotransferase class V-fold PLP-dependent enzyme [Arenicella sp.]|nr:aminotransferase class V-fold PLP-dependent enzyme [Arenicella sp.]
MSEIKELFCVPESSHYFLTHSIGLMPKSTEAHLSQAYLKPWQSGAEDIWPQWLNAIANFNGALASLLNSEPEQFCPQANVSSGLAKLIQSLPKVEGRNVILATQSDFPSAGFVLQQAERLGFTIRYIAKGQDLQSLDVWSEALADDVYCAFITHAHYNTNTLTPAAEITQLCRARGIMSIMDIAQSVGIVPIDLHVLDVDVVVGSCIKWLCGGPGAGYLWLRKERIQQLNPIDVGWFSHENPFEFDINNFDYASTAARFWGGTPSVASYIIASNSIKLMTEIGVQNIREHNRNLCQKIMSNVPKDCIASPTDLTKKGGTVVLKFSNSEQIEARLRDKNVLFDARQYGIRLSPHIYTDERDIDVLLGCLT